MRPETETQSHRAGRKHLTRVDSVSSTGEWKGFSFSHGNYILHIPTTTLLEVPAWYSKSIENGRLEEKVAQKLAWQASQLKTLRPQPPLPPRDIRSIALNVEQGCNLRCTYCFAGTGDYGHAGTMTFATAKAAIEQLSKGKQTFKIIFFGGEPLLNFSLIRQVVEWCQNQQTIFTFSITTNGTLLSEQKMQFLKKHQFRITLSYDGKKAQDIHRKTVQGDGSLDWLQKKIERFRADLAKMETTFRATVTPESLEPYLEGLPEQIEEYKTEVAHKMATSITPGSKSRFSNADHNRIERSLSEIVQKILEGNKFQQLKKIPLATSYLKALKKGQRQVFACQAGLQYISVSTGGEYFLCHRFTEDRTQAVGSIETGLDQAKLDEILAFRMGTREPCSSCWMRELCRGGCFHANKIEKDSIFEPAKSFCDMNEIGMKLNIFVYTWLQKFNPGQLESL